MTREASPATWLYPGARWWKVDLHTHTPESKDTRAWQQAIGTQDEVTPQKWLLQCMSSGLDCVAVTDHNTGEWIDRLKAAYADLEVRRPEGFRPLVLFPGVEITVNGGFHLLVILDVDKSSLDVQRLLGAVEYEGEPGGCDGTTRKSAIEVIEKICAASGLAIPAHVDQKVGLLRPAVSGSGQAALQAALLRQVLEREEILAMEVVDPSFSPPALYGECGCTWSSVVGSDFHSFRNGVPGSRFTWIKMERPSLEGLRLALLDGERFSIRRSDTGGAFDPFVVPQHLVEGIKIENARFMGRDEGGEQLFFGPWLNALVGGRGTGKSTVIHFLRLAYRRERELDALGVESEPRKTFERFDHVGKSREDPGGLCPGTEAVVMLRRDGVRYRLRWRQDTTGTVVEEETASGWQASASQAVTAERFPIRLFSQGQIAVLAGEDQEALLGVLDDAAGTAKEKEVLEEARQAYYALQARVRELTGRLERRGKLQVELEDAERKLQRFEAAHHAEVLRAYQLRSRQEREVQRQVESARQVADRLASLADDIAPEDLPGRLFDPDRAEDQAALQLVESLQRAIRDAGSAIRSAGATLRGEADRLRGDIGSSPWHAAVRAGKEAYEALIANLRQAGVADPGEYGKLVQERQRLEQEKVRLESMSEERQQLVAEGTARLAKVQETRRELSRRRAAFLQEFLSGNDYVRIELVPYGHHPRPIERSLRELLGAVDDRFESDIYRAEEGIGHSGFVAELVAAADARRAWAAGPEGGRAGEDPVEVALESIKERLESTCRGDGRFGGHLNNYLARECEKKPELLDRLLTWFPEDALKVDYSRNGSGADFRPIEQGSAGERSAAMLAFLLAYGEEPLVLDQPEDDLDNHLIYDLVVRQIKESKLRRQIIVVTHNPNIVVNGDAEMVHALAFRGGQCRVMKRGSLQEKEMRDEVCQIMEGGREAFERRFHRLGREI